MMDVWSWLAVTCSGLFAGGAAFVTVAEHPGRLAAGVDVALAEFGPSYVRAAPWQAGLAVVALVAGLNIGSSVRAATLLMGGVLVLSVVALAKPSHALISGHAGAPDALRLLRRWGRLHAVRAVLGTGAFLAYVGGV